MIRLRSKLKEWFSAGKRPTGEQFADLIDSFYHKTEDALPTGDLSAFAQALDNKADKNHTHDINDIKYLSDTLVGLSEDMGRLAGGLNGKADTDHTHQMSEVEGLGEALEGKADAEHTHQMSEVEGLGEALGKSAAYITKTWRSGYSWYRVYSDGWVEQGGRNAIKENATLTVDLHKKMKDTSYQVMVTNNCTHTAKDAEGVLTATSASVSQIKIHAGYINPNSTNVWWEVKGMMASDAS